MAGLAMNSPLSSSSGGEAPGTGISLANRSEVSQLYFTVLTRDVNPTVEACFRELRLFILWVPLRAKTVFRTQKDLKHWSDDSFLTASSIPLTLLSGFTHEI